MEIRLDQIGDEPFHWQENRSVPVESLERSQLLELGEVGWEGEITRTNSGFLLTARLRYSQALECPRCLGRSPGEIESEVELLIQPKSKEPVVGELELEESDLGVLYLEDEILNTDPILIEQIQLNVPMRQLCRQDCAGLCPQCGIDRNVDSCECDEVVDPRWASLTALRDRLEN
ncbi:MAG: DUF177 domain-containing protein [bacterium]|nr:DUF177 domain-containing protein [bacterium]